MIKHIHINHHVIRSNTENGEMQPCIIVKTSKSNTHCHGVTVHGTTKVIYSPTKPLSCGAKVWLETEGKVECEWREHHPQGFFTETKIIE